MTVTPFADRTALDDGALREALHETLALKNKMTAALSAAEHLKVHPNYTASANNLVAYLALRAHDIRPLQRKLSKLGLSSLGQCEANTLASLGRVIDMLQRLVSTPPPAPGAAPARQDQGENLLDAHAQALFAGQPPARGTRIMVTMPTEAAHEYTVVKAMLEAGMDCQRINCAHDDPPAWRRMIEHARRAAKTCATSCSVMMDLAGPKLRTGKIEPAPAVVRLRPSRDAFGRVITPATVGLYHGQYPTTEAAPGLEVPRQWLSQLCVDDIIAFRDAREAKRRMRITHVAGGICRAELHKTAYVVPGVELKLKHHDGRPRSARVLAVPRKAEQSITLKEGDTLILTGNTLSGRPAVLDKAGNVVTPARVGCTLPSVFKDVKVGEPIGFDDGKIGGVIDAVKGAEVHVRINHAPGGAKLKADKGINLPRSELTLEPLSPADLQALEFACEHADGVQMSFVNTAQDVEALIGHLTRLDALHMGVVLKIETRRAFDNLPQLILAGMRLPKLGVMIARGDLSIETGFERTAELQEEMLCLCEAAHVPVIWATQVLETLAKTGNPSRAEITDAAMGGRAECVMLNKGPYILDALGCLNDVLNRMQAHRSKKAMLMRQLHVAQRPLARPPLRPR